MTGLMRVFRDDFRQQVRQTPNTVVLVDARTEKAWSWRELDDLTNRLAAYLAAQGLSAGDTVLSLLPNSVEQLTLFLTCLKFGFNFAPLSPQSTAREIGRLTGIVKAKLALTLPQATGLATNGSDMPPTMETRSLIVNGHFAWLEGISASAHQVPPGEPRESLLYILTGGTTGEPKVMAIDGDRLWSSGRAFVSMHGFLDSDCRFYNIMPMSYLGGLFNLGLIPMATGGSTVVAEPFSGIALMRFWHDVARFDVNMLWLVPTMVRALLRAAKHNRGKAASRADRSGAIRAAFLGTAPIDLTTKEEFEKRFGILLLENFGLSETTFVTNETLDSRVRRTEGSVGEILPYVSVRLSQAGSKDLGEGISRIVVQTPFLFRGYLQQDGSLQLPITDDGYFVTGDLGHLWKDRTLVIDGRERDIIKKGGLLISLPEIEAIACQAPDVAEAAAVEVLHDFYGEDYVLFVTLRSVDAEQMAPYEMVKRVRAWITENLVQTKWPSRIVPTPDLPKTHSGKIAKSALKALLAASPARASAH